MAARHKFDPAWLDRQYNNRALVPEHARITRQWADDSARVRHDLSRRLDVRYGRGPNETLDLFPSQVRDAPVLVFIHGGYWRSFDKSDHSFIAPAFVRGGAMVVVPNYALCPAVTIEQITMQMVHALAWVHRHAALYGGDPRRIVVAGHSAGGHLAAMMASCQWKAVGRDLPANLVRGALAISGLFDMLPIAHTPFLAPDLRLDEASARRLSPAGFPAPRVPVYAAVGALESDEFRRQNRLLRSAWGDSAVPVCDEVAGRNHFDVLESLADPGGHLHALAWRLLDTV